MKEKISFSTRITDTDLYRYNLHYAYTSTQGIFSIVLAVFLLGMWIVFFKDLRLVNRVLYPAIAVLFLVYLPMNLKIRSKQQSLQEVFQYPLSYVIDEVGVTVSSPTTEEPAILPWEYVYKVATYKEYLLIYSNRVNAYIIPKESIADCYDDVIEYMKAHLEDYKIAIK